MKSKLLNKSYFFLTTVFEVLITKNKIAPENYIVLSKLKKNEKS